MNVSFNFNIALVGGKGKAEPLCVARRGREGRRDG